MTEEQRLAWEKQQGFTSFATKSNEVYAHVAETFNSVENLKSLVEKNKKFIELTIENHEFTLENKLRNNSNRFLINTNKILKIDTIFYKFFDEYTILTSINYLNELIQITDDNLLDYYSNNNFLFIKNNTCILKNYSEDYGNYKHKHAFDDDEKQRIRLEVSVNQMWDRVTMNMFISFNADFINHNKKLGAWIKCKRTIIADLKTRIDYVNPSLLAWKYYTLAGRVNIETYEYNINYHYKQKVQDNNEVNIMLDSPPHFGALKCLFRNLSTNYSDIYYNESFLRNYNTDLYPWYNELFFNII